MIAIHERKGSFSDQWIQYCKEKDIPFKIVNCYENDIIAQLKNCKVLMWHHHHMEYKDYLLAKNVLFALEQSGKKVFPNFNTGWHFDDKLAQKYLLEGIEAPTVPSFVFYDKQAALEWAKSTDFPKVFKLRRGAGGRNVKLVRTESECNILVNKAFSKGFSPFNRFGHIEEVYKNFKKGKGTFLSLVRAFGRLIIPTDFAKLYGKERNYIYFQEFIPNNDGDYRVIIIGQKYAYGMKRLNRENDFRASGSSSFVYEELPESMLKVAFNVAERLKLQSVAFDFIRDVDNNPLIIEMSYGFGTIGSSKCTGYWSSDLIFHKGEFNPQGWMIDEVLNEN